MTRTTKEKALNLLDWEVRAILDGRKTQLRVPIKLPRWARGREIEIDDFGLPSVFSPTAETHVWLRCPFARIKATDEHGYMKPHYASGQRVWVKETYGFGWRTGGKGYTAIPASGETKPDKVFYKADGFDESQGKYQWRRSSTMPRWASRLTLEITDVRVERLDSITREDAIAEGIHPLPGQDADDPSAWWESAPGKHQGRDPLESFRKLWIDINGVGSWVLNPWVWALSFTRA